MKHVIEEEKKMWEADGLSEAVERMQFEVNGSSEEESSDSELSGIEEIE